MPVGLNTVNLANAILNHLTKQAAWTEPAGLYVKLHLAAGDPGSAGASNPSTVTTREPASFAAAATAAIALTGTNPSWNMTAAESIGYISVWDNVTNGSGSFLWSAQLSATKTVASGDTLTLTACGLSLGPLAS